MVIKIRRRHTVKEWIMLIVFYLLLLQSPLTDKFPYFAYIDEGYALLGLVMLIYQAVKTKRFRIKRTDTSVFFLLLIFIVTGLAGNVLYQYQPMQAVLIDFYTNIKFFLGIVAGSAIFSVCYSPRVRETLTSHARFVSCIFFVLLCIDVLFHIYPSAGLRFGMRSVRLMYRHPTYLAGSVVLLMAILLSFYEKKNLPYMVFSSIVLAATLRGKALGGAFAYIMIFYFLIYAKKKINPIHIAIMVLVSITIGWEQIQFYFIDLSGTSARSMLVSTSFQIMKDYFPIGTGFGTYASASAVEFYSPVYYKYGLNYIWGLSEDFSSFGSDSFWPIIIGQTGVIGTVCFVGMLALLFLRLQRMKKMDMHAYAAGLFIFAYIMICSTAEPAFHNSVAVALTLILGFVFSEKSNKLIRPSEKQ